MGLIIGPPLIIHSGGGGGNKDKWLDPVSAEFTRRTSGGSLSVGSRAKIGSVKGRTLVWNQMVKNGNFASNTGISLSINSQSSVSWSVSNNELIVNVATQASTNDLIKFSASKNIIVGHKYYMSLEYTVDKTAYLEWVLHYSNGCYIRETCSPGSGRIRGIVTPSVVFNGYVGIYFGYPTAAQDNSVFKFRNAMVIDLTLMFGAGNEPSTADEFEALYNNPYYDFDEGAIINNSASAIKTIGFNQWDEVVEDGLIEKNTGADIDSKHYRRTKNYTPIFPNTDYYIKSPIGLLIFFYDSNKMFIVSQTIQKSSVITTPESAAYMRFRNNVSDAWPTYYNDISFNLSWSGDRNGEYKRYWENSLALNLTTLTGKLSGQSPVVIFPDGMKSVGNIYDELTKTTATKRIGSQVVSGSAGDAITLVGCDTTALSYVCSTNIGTLSGGVLTLTADVSEVAVYFALATPEVYTLDSPLSLSYRVDSFGTEERLPADTPSELSAPIRIEVSYTEPKPKDIKPVLSGPLLGAGGDDNETQYETDS